MCHRMHFLDLQQLDRWLNGCRGKHLVMLNSDLYWSVGKLPEYLRLINEPRLCAQHSTRVRVVQRYYQTLLRRVWYPRL